MAWRPLGLQVGHEIDIFFPRRHELSGILSCFQMLEDKIIADARCSELAYDVSDIDMTVASGQSAFFQFPTEGLMLKSRPMLSQGFVVIIILLLPHKAISCGDLNVVLFTVCVGTSSNDPTINKVSGLK